MNTYDPIKNAMVSAEAALEALVKRAQSGILLVGNITIADWASITDAFGEVVDHQCGALSEQAKWAASAALFEDAKQSLLKASNRAGRVMESMHEARRQIARDATDLRRKGHSAGCPSPGRKKLIDSILAAGSAMSQIPSCAKIPAKSAEEFRDRLWIYEVYASRVGLLLRRFLKAIIKAYDGIGLRQGYGLAAFELVKTAVDMNRECHGAILAAYEAMI